MQARRAFGRSLESGLFAYALLAAYQCGHARRWLASPPAGLWCGNVISDPFLFLARVVGPLAAASALALVLASRGRGRWPTRAVAPLLAFAAATALLVHEGIWLQRECGLELASAIWWLPRP